MSIFVLMPRRMAWPHAFGKYFSRVMSNLGWLLVLLCLSNCTHVGFDTALAEPATDESLVPQKNFVTASSVSRVEPDTEAIDVDVNKKSGVEVDARAHPKNAPVAPWFSLTKNHARGYCEAFLEMINQGSWDDLGACHLPESNVDTVTYLEGEPLPPERLKNLDKLFVAAFDWRLKERWQEEWPERLKLYESGYHQLSLLQADVDWDGTDEQVLIYRAPNRLCIERTTLSPIGQITVRSQLAKQKWAAMSIADKTKSANEFGLRSWFYILDSTEKMKNAMPGRFVAVKGKPFGITQTGMRDKWIRDGYVSRNWVSLFRPYYKSNNKGYGGVSLCHYYLN